MLLTSEMLDEAGACTESVEKVKTFFPNGFHRGWLSGKHEWLDYLKTIRFVTEDQFKFCKKNIAYHIYNKENKRIKAINHEGECITYLYDKEGRLVRMETDSGYFMEYTFDESGNITQTHCYGFDEYYTFNEMGLMTRRDSSDGSWSTYDYNDVGLIIKETCNSGFYNTYTYDDKNRLIRKDQSDGYYFTYKYDDKDMQIEEKEPNSILTKTYDEKGRLVKAVFDNGSCFLYEHNYDDSGKLIREYHTDKYDEQISKIIETDESMWWRSFTYDSKGRLSRIEESNGQFINVTYPE